MEDAIIIRNVEKRLKGVKKSQRRISEILKKPQEFFALRNITLAIGKGEKVAVIGKNGSGKSTLLRIMAKIQSPSRGHVNVFGRLAYLSGFGSDLNPQLSMRENIYYKATLMGLKKKEIEEIFDKVMEFCELGEYIDTQIACFSTGMVARLAFSIGMSSLEKMGAQVVILDEVLGSGGDIDFNNKAKERIERFFKKPITIVLATHNLSSAAKLCDRIIWLEEGKVFLDGPASRVSEKYYMSLKQKEVD